MTREEIDGILAQARVMDAQREAFEYTKSDSSPDTSCRYCGHRRQDHWGPHPIVEGICSGFVS